MGEREDHRRAYNGGVEIYDSFGFEISYRELQKRFLFMTNIGQELPQQKTRKIGICLDESSYSINRVLYIWELLDYK